MSHTKRKISLIALLFLSITSNSHCIGDESIEPIAIYHAFDKKFKDIKKKLTAIEKAGYSHIQISPCQEHRRSLPHTFIFDIKKQYLLRYPDVIKQAVLNTQANSMQDDSPQAICLSDGDIVKLFREKVVPQLKEEGKGECVDDIGNPIKDLQGNNLKEQWWLAYQPTGYEIDSQYGTKDDLVSLIVKAKQHNLKIIADIVFNHTAAPDGVEKNEWLQALENAHAGYPNQYNMYMTQLQKVHSSFNLPEHFNPFKMNRSPYYHWNTDEQKIKIIKAYDEPRIWMAGALPSLNLDHDAVWNAQSKYLEDLIEIGIKGFRFDLLAFFDPERHWQKYHNFLKEKKAFAYGELITEKNNYPPFIQHGRTTDHEFAKALESAFSHPDDDMRKLRMPTTNGDPGSITYTNTHDMETYRVGNKIKDPVNRKLATLFLIARRDGIPLILDHDHDDETNTQEFESAIQFRKIMIQEYGNPEELIVDTENCSDIASAEEDTSSRTIMIMTREDKGFMILNMRGEALEAIFKFPGTKINGFYRRIGDLNNTPIEITEEGCPLSIPSRSAVFFVQADQPESVSIFELQ